MQRLLPVFYIVVCFVSVTGLPHQSVDFPPLEQRYEVANLPRIVNGEDATPGEFPYQCSLKAPFLGFFKIHVCGAVIYNQFTLITAAHCVEGQTASKLRVVCGDLDMGSAEGTEQSRDIESYTIHPDRNVQTKEADLAILTLTQPLDWSEFVQPVKLADEGFFTQHQQDNLNSIQCQSIGWGNTKPEGTGLPMVLQKVSLQIVPPENCQSRYEGLIDITSSMVCAGWVNPEEDDEQKGTCTGDSGGPLLCSHGENEVPQLLGIVSFGTKPCALTLYPSVFASIPELGSWLKHAGARKLP